MKLTEAFGSLDDPRTGPARRHDLREMILMALCAVLCGADTWVDVAEWAEDNEAWLKRYLVLEHGTPSHDTFGRVFRLLDAKVFETCFREWIGSLAGVVAGVVAIDGKTACGSRDGHNTALHTISAYATASGLCLGQEHPRGKGNEIPAIKALLDTLALKGCIVTIDAIGCQTEIAQKILDRGGDYLLAVKDNQKDLADALREFFAEGETWGSRVRQLRPQESEFIRGRFKSCHYSKVSCSDSRGFVRFNATKTSACSVLVVDRPLLGCEPFRVMRWCWMRRS